MVPDQMQIFEMFWREQHWRHTSEWYGMTFWALSSSQFLGAFCDAEAFQPLWISSTFFSPEAIPGWREQQGGFERTRWLVFSCIWCNYLLTLFNPGNQADPSQLNIEFFACLLIFAKRGLVCHGTETKHLGISMYKSVWLSHQARCFHVSNPSLERKLFPAGATLCFAMRCVLLGSTLALALVALQGCGDEVTYPECASYSKNSVGPLTDATTCRTACVTRWRPGREEWTIGGLER